MQEDFEVIENPPEQTTFTCKGLFFLVVGFLYGFPYILAFIGWIKFNIFVGFCFLVFGYLVNGVIHSKMRQVSIPKDQRETSFNSIEIAKWFVGCYLLCEK